MTLVSYYWNIGVYAMKGRENLGTRLEVTCRQAERVFYEPCPQAISSSDYLRSKFYTIDATMHSVVVEEYDMYVHV